MQIAATGGTERMRVTDLPIVAVANGVSVQASTDWLLL